jgi:hypothetical protein
MDHEADGDDNDPALLVSRHRHRVAVASRWGYAGLV